jgi:hypothetical protein
MSTRRKRRLPLTVWRKLAVLDTFFAPTAKRRTPRDRSDAMALLIEYAGGGTPEAVPTESGRCYICTFPAKWVREAIPGVGLIPRNRILLCGRHHEELESLLAAETERKCEPIRAGQEARLVNCGLRRQAGGVRELFKPAGQLPLPMPRQDLADG